MNGWCAHPGEERQRVFSGDRGLTDRQLCGLCGEVVYLSTHADYAVSGVPTVTRK